MKVFLGFAIGIILVVFAGIYLSSRDPIGAEVVHTNADLTIGSTVVNDLQQGFNMIMKWILGATLAGVGIAVFTEVKKIYRMWFLERTTRRWKSGPNARWQPQQSVPRAPSISRADLLMMALANGQQRLQGLRTRFGSKSSVRSDGSEDELNIDL